MQQSGKNKNKQKKNIFLQKKKVTFLFRIHIFAYFSFFVVVYFPSFLRSFCPCNFGHKLLRFLHCLPIKFSKIWIYFWLFFVKWKCFPYNIFMCIISLTIIFCICWMKAEVCHFCSTSIIKQSCINNNGYFLAVFSDSQVNWCINPMLLCWAMIWLQLSDADVTFWGEFIHWLIYLFLSEYLTEKNYTLQL